MDADGVEIGLEHIAQRVIRLRDGYVVSDARETAAGEALAAS